MEKERKNFAPAVMTVRGPYTATSHRLKSKDGKFTAGGVSMERQDEDDRPEYQHEQKVDPNKKNDAVEIYFNKRIYPKLAHVAFRHTLFKDLVSASKSAPGSEPVCIQANSYVDQELGIDYFLAVRTNDPNNPYTNEWDIDLKVVNTFGDIRKYVEPQLTLSLYQKRNDEKDWKFGSFLNRNHQNNSFCYLIPNCVQSKAEIFKRSQENPEFRPYFNGMKMHFVDKMSLQQYVASRIMNNRDVQTAIGCFQTGNEKFLKDPSKNKLFEYMHETSPHNYEFEIPCPGENFKYTLAFRRDEGKGYSEINVHISDQIMNSIPTALSYDIPLK